MKFLINKIITVIYPVHMFVTSWYCYLSPFVGYILQINNMLPLIINLISPETNFESCPF